MLALQSSGTNPLTSALEATGYMVDGQAAHGVALGQEARRSGRWRSFEPDAMWEGESSLRVYFQGSTFPAVPGPARQLAQRGLERRSGTATVDRLSTEH